MLRRTLDLLPEIFRTDTNQKFLAATLDQLVQESSLKRTQGYVGRRIGPGVNPADNYVTEINKTRTDYQLEPAVTFLQPDTSTAYDVITYPGMLDALSIQGAETNKQDRLWKNQYYSWDPFCDLDKFNNYSQYYWLPSGPDPVDVSATDVPLSDDYVVTRTSTDYAFSGIPGKNPILTLVRGGNYSFQVAQSGHDFWIQTVPGTAGVLPATPNVSSRSVLGVVNNGTDNGIVDFYVPLKTAQDFYYSMSTFGPVDLICDLQFDQINDVYVDVFFANYPTGIDGQIQIQNKTLIFTYSGPNGWINGVTPITSQSERYSIWQVKYVDDGFGDLKIQLINLGPVSNLTKCNILYGDVNSSTQWYKNASGYFQQVPLLTAVLDTLYYQDSSNPEIVGQIKLIDPTEVEPININDILGAKTFTSPNGVQFTNGLKVQFRGPTVPAEFQNQTFYVEGVGSGPGVLARVGFIDGRPYFGKFHTVSGQRMTGASGDGTFHQYIYDTYEESMEHYGEGGPAGAPLPAISEVGAASGQGILLLPTSNFITPETYTQNQTIAYDEGGYDIGNFDGNTNAPLTPDYIVMNRASQDLNSWSRCNRWFHKDVIVYTAELNNQVAVLNNEYRGKRPIIEFRSNLQLFNYGTQSKGTVNVIDFVQTDAFSNIKGQLGYGYDGYNFENGSRVIFAADVDPLVRNKIWEIRFIDPNNSGTDIIDIVSVPLQTPLVSQTITVLNGNIEQGLSYWFDGVTWVEAQQKNSINQAPLFDVFDPDSFSLSNTVVYPSSTFLGSKLFGYASNATGTVDVVLGFGLQFLNFNNVGDIVFDNYFYNDTFLYVNNSVSNTAAISLGFPRQYFTRTLFTNELGWQRAPAESQSRQVFSFVYDGLNLVLDVPVDSESIYPAVQLYVEGKFVDPSNYTVDISSTNTTITLLQPVPIGAVINAQVLSDTQSAVAFYQVPVNLENNALNQNSPRFTLGTIRTHYDSIGQNLKTLVGPINGSNNIRDLGNVIPYGTNIVQHSAPLALSGVFLRQQQYQLFNSIRYNSVEYEKFKARLLDLTIKGNFINNTAGEILDAVIDEMSLGRSNISPFYWSDMLPAGNDYTELNFTYTDISTNVFDTDQIYNFTSSNFQSVLVYLNGALLTVGYDYVVLTNTAAVEILLPLALGDKVTIREYAATYGTYVPNTPTKMGLYPSWKPRIFLDDTYVTDTLVIQGHDGSITVAFNDIRDDVLLEYEKRVYNNLKIKSDIPLSPVDVIPGQFRTTDYSLSDINTILSEDFLSWVGYNKLDYISQTYFVNNAFTYNYSQSADKLTNKALLGAWRGIYLYFYDTISPNTTPWEMLGFSEEPYWWVSRYGPAPYTSGNLVLWQDLADGKVVDPNGTYFLPQYRRPNLLSCIPAGSEGELLNPLQSCVGNYNATSFRRSWTFGDDGPVENVWRTSSSYPFALMRLLALTLPAKFLSLFVDRDRYLFNHTIDQYVWDERYRLQAKNITPLYGDGTSKASYINWIIDYNRQLGVNSTTQLTTDLANIDIRLAWRLGAFSDKKYLKIYLERSTPRGTNTSLLLPDESFQLLLYKNQPFNTVAYSSVIVQTVENGYAVFGYNNSFPYFQIIASRPNGKTQTIAAGGTSVKVPVEYYDSVVRVPYGFIFSSRSAVCDFLVSYGEFLRRQNFTFEGKENGYIMNWLQMAQEFLYWSNSGWGPGSLINLNPGATKLSVAQAGAVVDSLVPTRLDNVIINQNRQPINVNDLIINRFGNEFQVISPTSDTLSYMKVEFTAYEHLVVFDNTSLFGDLVYNPSTGARQSRVYVSGWLSGDWDGTVNAPGFVLNQDNILEWNSKQVYTKGSIVLYKDQYWSASTIIQPSRDFNYNLWLKSDYDQIQKGLLPNSPNASDQLALAYNKYSANLEKEIDLFAFGLIGFRPRTYMQALNLDDVSQVNLYQQFLGTKGTKRSAEIFSFANLGKEIAEYNIYEFWGIQRGQYGATANRNYVELRLNQSLLNSDPSIVQIILPEQVSPADQTVLLEDVWKQSAKLTSPDFLPTAEFGNTETALPSAGYVDLDDVDVALFSLSNASALDPYIDTIGIGSTVWVAKINEYSWTVYRVDKVYASIISAADNLNDTTLLTFNLAHGLAVGNYVIVKYFNAAINGVYQVLAIPSITEIIVALPFTATDILSGTGLALTLQTARVAQPSDIPSLPFALEILPGAKVWVDNNGLGRWTVLEKSNPFSYSNSLQQAPLQESSRFASAVAQGLYNLSAFVGAPGYNPTNLAAAPGGLYVYVKNSQNTYEQNGVIQLTTTGISGLGNSIDIGNQTWAVIGASASNNNQGYAVFVYSEPGSNVFDVKQLVVAPDQDFGDIQFGFDVTMSLNERWAFVSAPGKNKVYAFTQLPVAFQAIEYVTTLNNLTYNYSDAIVIDYNYPDQLIVSLDNNILIFGIDYAVGTQDITLSSAPPVNKALTIARRQSIQLDQTLSKNVEQSSTSGTGVGAVFEVNNARGNYTVICTAGGSGYVVGDTIVIDQDDVATLQAPPPAPLSKVYVSDAGTTLTLNNTTGLVAGMTIAGTGFDSGQYITDVLGGSNIIINQAPDSTPAGSIVFSHNIVLVVTAVGTGGSLDTFDVFGEGVSNTSIFNLQDYLAMVQNIWSFSVTVNDVLYRPFIDYDFNSDSATLANDLVFNLIPPAGASIFVDASTKWNYVQTLTVSGLAEDANFGHAVSCNSSGTNVMVGAPGVTNDTGTVYIFDRNIQSFTVTDTAITKYYPVQSMDSPGSVQVSLNGVYLTDANLNINPGYSIDTSVPGFEYVEILTTLTVGDIVTVETNQFTLLESDDSVIASANDQFGYELDQCVNDCSLYIGAPFSTTETYNNDQSILALETGHVEFLQNQPRVYGTITSLIANPSLTAGDYIRINNFYVELTGTTVADLVNDIIAAAVPNVTASSTTNLQFISDGETKTYNVGTLYADAVSYTTVVLVDGVMQTSGVNYTYNASTQNIIFVAAPDLGSTIEVVSGRINIFVSNYDASTPLNRLQVAPGNGTVFNDLGFDIYTHQQTILAPVTQAYAHFGQSIFISENTTTLTVGAPNGSTITVTSFDGGETTFDDTSCRFFDLVLQSGAVYTYDALPSAVPSVDNPLQFVFGQQIIFDGVQPLDQFGASVDYTTGTMLIGLPGSDIGDSNAQFGQAAVYNNVNLTPAWRPIRLQQAVVNSSLLNTVFIYDVVTNQPKQYLDWIDPLQGKILGIARQNIDYIGPVDPAMYTSGNINNIGLKWGIERAGQIWWDTAKARFLNPHQNDLVYASRQWGLPFPGSEIEVYQWVASDQPPSAYTGEGTPRSTTSFVTTNQVNAQGIIETSYYFWVQGISAVAVAARKTLSISTIARYIENPKSSLIPYIAPLNASTVALYNSEPYIQVQDSILHLEYDKVENDNAVHLEFQLIADGKAVDFLNNNLYRKFLDSLTGVDTRGAAVPDTTLPVSEQYGVQFRPRQSMFVNRFLALKNYINYCNTVIKQFPISETKSFEYLNSSEPEPAVNSGKWNMRVANIEELGYQNLYAVPLGYRYLVAFDITNQGLWSIYEVIVGDILGNRTTRLVEVQNYDTRKYWSYVDWYALSFNPLSLIIQEVSNYAALATLSLPVNSNVKITANAQGKWEIYTLTTTGWARVGLQNGTIQISNSIWDYAAGRFGFDSEVFDAQYFDQAPTIETRKILQAINENIFVNELLIERNQALILMFDFILQEQIAPLWLSKTSLIDVDHVIRQLIPFQVYRADNQDFVLNYITEVKPYHTQIRQFNLIYRGDDTYQGTLTDFDLPSYYDTYQGQYVSPVLDNIGNLSTTSSRSSSWEGWQTFPYNQWYNNYLLTIESVAIVSGGSGYQTAPVVTVTGDCEIPAQITSQINSAGVVVALNIIYAGKGYSTTAILTFESAAGSGASAVAVMSNGLVRNLITTIKYDRYQYRSDIFEWQANVSYAAADLVRYDNRAWQAIAAVNTSTFDPDDWQFVPADDLSGVNRTMAYYTPTVNQPGLDLSLLISGVDYPGVQVQGPNFSQNTGFDVGGFDQNPYDNISYGPEGRPTYDPSILDTIFESEFTDPYLGVLPAPAYNGVPPTTGPNPISIVGGEFVGTYESYAPEELVPGVTYDTLDFKVFTTPGSDWTGDGHGWPLSNTTVTWNATTPTISFDLINVDAVALFVFNRTQGTLLSLNNDYTINWVGRNVTITSGASTGDIIGIEGVQLGGGNQMYTKSYIGSEIPNQVLVPISIGLLEEFVIHVNGSLLDHFNYEAVGTGATLIKFSTALTASDYVTITALGTTTDSVNSGWSLPVTQIITSDGTASYSLTNSLTGTNPGVTVLSINGIRQRPPAGLLHIADGSSAVFELPYRLGFSQALIADNDVFVYVDNTALTLGIGFTVDAFTGPNRTVTLTTTPTVGEQVLVVVKTNADYYIVGDTLNLNVATLAGDIIDVVTWNDTSEQWLVNMVFVGPETPGGNRFDTGFNIIDGTRLIVSLDGDYLFNNQGYVIDGSIVEISGATIGAGQVVVITYFTQSAVPAAIAFRIFQDMRGQQLSYRITDESTTALTQYLSHTDDIIYVADASRLSDPNLELGVFGQITINGERITYRYKNTVNNTVSGLRRGTAGTAAANHAVDTLVYDLGFGNLLPIQYQDYYDFENFDGDGTTITFIANNVNIYGADSSELDRAVEVLVGGILVDTSQYSVNSVYPVSITFDTAPDNGVEVTIRVRKALSWYQPGEFTASNGIALQEQTTSAAVFIKQES